MDAKLYLLIAAIVAILYALGFTLIPAYSVALYGAPSEPHLIFTVRILGSVLLALGVITWLARDFRDWTAVRTILIGGVVADVIGALITASGTIQGTVNALGWASTIVDVLLALWALYLLFTGSRKPARA